MTNYEIYADITGQIAALEDRLVTVRAEIEKELPDDGYKDERVTAFWTSKRKWTYPQPVKSAEKSLKALKKASEEDGTATSEEIKQLTIKVK